MERAAATPLSFGPPTEGAPPVPMEQSLAKRPRPPAEAEQEPASDEEQEATDTDANFDLSFHQEGDYTFQDMTVYAAIVELLLELEGVDPEPDFWARSITGPWHVAVNEDCAQQFQERYGELTTLRVNQTDITVRVKIESIEAKINKRGSTSRKSLYTALQDVAAHLVVEADGLAQAKQLNLSVLIKAIEKEGLTFLKGNRERMKLEGGAGTFVSKAAYSTRWHLYVSAGQGSLLDGSFPRKLIVNVGNATIPVNYGVRACKTLSMPASIQSPHKLMIHGALLAPQLRCAGAEGGADAVAAMFCIQFAFGSEATASILMAQVSSLLKPGGVFFGTAPDASAVLKLLNGKNSVTLEPPEFPFVLRLKRVDGDAVPKGARSDGANEMRQGIEPQMAHRTRAAEGSMVPETGRRDGKRGDGGSVTRIEQQAEANAGGKTEDGEGTSSLRIGPQHDDEFGHGLCFSLQDTVTHDSDDLTDAHEYLVWRETLTRLAEAHGLVPIAIESMYRAVGKMRGRDGRGGQTLPVLSEKEAQVAQLYFSFAFRKQAGRVPSTDMAPSGVGLVVENWS